MMMVEVMTILTVVMFFDPGSNWLRMSGPVLSPSSLPLRRSRSRMISTVISRMISRIISRMISRMISRIISTVISRVAIQDKDEMQLLLDFWTRETEVEAGDELDCWVDNRR